MASRSIAETIVGTAGGLIRETASMADRLTGGVFPPLAGFEMVAREYTKALGAPREGEEEVDPLVRILAGLINSPEFLEAQEIAFTRLMAEGERERVNEAAKAEIQSLRAQVDALTELVAQLADRRDLSA